MIVGTVELCYTLVMHDQVIDANVNRASEGLRVVEEYVRFVRSDKDKTDRIARVRKTLNALFSQSPQFLASRSTTFDVRSREVPSKRASIFDVLSANFKRVQEALRVLEEFSGQKICNQLRYDVYDLEQSVLLLASKPFIKKGFYIISDDVDVLKKGVDWKCSFVQLRSKTDSKETVFNKASEIALYASRKHIPFIVNDYIDIAILVDAEGVHTGQDDILPSDQRKLFGEHKIIGRTCHTLEQGLDAEKKGADYVSVGPLFETPSKPGRKGIGLDYLKQAPLSLSIPYVAIGGIDEAVIDTVMDCNPYMVGVIRNYSLIPKWQRLYFN